MPSESELLEARLGRMKRLLDTLEDACSNSREHQKLFLKLREEIAAAREGLKTVLSPSE
jgi:hypothetical protein